MNPDSIVIPPDGPVNLLPGDGVTALNLEQPRKKVFIKTYGCQMNEYDTNKLLKILEPNFDAVGTSAEADMVLINTCSVRDKPEQKLYSLLGELKELKDQNPRLMIGVGGCVAQQEGKTIVSRSKAVDFVFGTHNLSLVPSLIEMREQGSPPQVAVDYRDEWEELPLGLVGEGKVSVLVSISRGCNKNCSYCIVPATRGKEVSRSFDEILRETKIAVHRGAREIILLGQTVNSYGLDLTPRMKFTELLQKLSEVPGLERIRFVSPHPQEIRQDFIELVSTNSKVCRHIHMPLQAGSNRILKAMNRNYSRERYLAIITALKDRAPDIAITTDVIVGFPGETRAEFEETLDMIRTVQYDNTYSYIFSPRPGTAAEFLDDPVSLEEKKAWLHELQALQDEILSHRLESWVGKEVEVLVERPTTQDPNCLLGRTSQNIVLHLDPVSSSKVKAGDLVKVNVTKKSRYTLNGTLISLPAVILPSHPAI